MNSSQGKILVIRGGAIGDFILTLAGHRRVAPAISAAHLEVLGYPHIAQLALAGGLVNRVQSIEAGALAGFFARGGELAEDLADYFSEFDLILSYLYDPDRIFQTNVGALHRRPVYRRATPGGAKERDSMPRKSICSRSSGSPSSTPTPSRASRLLPASVSQPSTLNSQLRWPLHPGSGSESKNWPEANWAELLRHLADSTDLDLLLVGGEAEGERLQRLAAALPPARSRVAQSLPLAELARSAGSLPRLRRP